MHQSLFQDRLAVGRVLGQGIGAGKRRESRCVAVDHIQQLPARLFRTLSKLAQRALIRSVFFLSDRQRDDHPAQRGRESPAERGGASAARRGRGGGELSAEVRKRFIPIVHPKRSFQYIPSSYRTLPAR